MQLLRQLFLTVFFLFGLAGSAAAPGHHHPSCLLANRITAEPQRSRAPLPPSAEADEGPRYRHAAGLPRALDYRLSQGVVSAVKDQADCGSCWAFSATEAMEGQVGLNGFPIILAPQTFVDCVRADDGCGGGWPDDALAYAEEQGVAAEADYAYHANQTGFCRLTYPGPDDRAPVAARADVFYEVRANGSDALLKDALWEYGPLSVAIDASPMFMQYTGGVLNDTECQTDSPNHAVLLVGYGGANESAYWIIKNSWGAAWGEDGYVRLSANSSNACGIGMYATVPSVGKHASASKEEPSMRHVRHMAAVVEI